MQASHLSHFLEIPQKNTSKKLKKIQLMFKNKTTLKLTTYLPFKNQNFLTFKTYFPIKNQASVSQLEFSFVITTENHAKST